MFSVVVKPASCTRLQYNVPVDQFFFSAFYGSGIDLENPISYGTCKVFVKQIVLSNITQITRKNGKSCWKEFLTYPGIRQIHPATDRPLLSL